MNGDGDGHSDEHDAPGDHDSGAADRHAQRRDNRDRNALTGIGRSVRSTPHLERYVAHLIDGCHRWGVLRTMRVRGWHSVE